MTKLIVKYIFIINIYGDTNVDTSKELKDVHSFLYGRIEEIGKQIALRGYPSGKKTLERK